MSKFLIGVTVFTCAFTLTLVPAWADVNHDLAKAAKEGDVKLVESLLAKGADVNAKDKDGETLLMKAVWYGHTDLAKLLIEKGVDANAKDANGWTALMATAQRGETELAKFLIKRGADVNAKDSNGGTALMAAAQKEDIELAKFLIEKGAGEDAFDWRNWVIIAASVTDGNFVITKLMVKTSAVCMLVVFSSLAAFSFAIYRAVKWDGTGLAIFYVYRAVKWDGTIGLGIALSGLSIAIVGYAKVSPTLRINESLIWLSCVTLCVFAAFIVKLANNVRWSKAISVVWMTALVVSYYTLTCVAPNETQGCHTTKAYPVWDGYCVNPDSASYYSGWTPGSTRGPIYPWFIKLFTYGTGFNVQEFYNQNTKPGPIKTDPADPMMRVHRAQTVFLLGSAIVCCAVMMWALQSPLPVLLFLFFNYFQFLSAWELTGTLTEPLTQSWIFLIVGAFFAFTWSRKPYLIPLAGALCAASYLTRQSSIYSTLFLFAMILLGLASNWRLYWKWALAGLATCFILSSVPEILGAAEGGKLFQNQSSMQYQYKITYALQVAKPEDIELMPDEPSRKWLEKALAMKIIEDEKVMRTYKGLYHQMVYKISSNLYSIASAPAISEGMTPDSYMKIALPILAKRRADHLKFGFDFWKLSIAEPGLGRIRLPGLGPWAVYALCFIAIIIIRGREGFTALVLIIAHFAHLAISSLFAVPLSRMVWASDFLALIAMFVLAIFIAQKISAVFFVKLHAAHSGGRAIALNLE